MVTGHYVASCDDGRGGRALYRAADPDRDQSYFLFATTRAQLARLRFPLGGLPKARVRELAREFGLVNAEKADSQDICFVPSGHYTEMIERLIPGASVPGEIVHADGRVLGRHGGVVHFTIGQRRGIGVAAAEPLYVGWDSTRQMRGVICRPARFALAVARLRLRDVNWIGPGAIAAFAIARIANCRAGFAPPVRPLPALLMPTSGEIEFVEPETGVLRPAKPVFSTIPSTRARGCSAGGSSSPPDDGEREAWPRSMMILYSRRSRKLPSLTR